MIVNLPLTSTVNTEVFAPNWHHAEIVDLCKSYWNPKRKMGVTTHFFQDN